MRAIKGYLDTWRIQEYLLITFFISWLSWGILILLTGFNIVKFQSVIGTILFMIGGFGPTISAIMCIDGKFSLRRIWQFIIAHRKKSIGYFLLFAALIIAVAILSNIASGNAWNELLAAAYPDTSSTMQLIFSVVGTFLLATLLSGGNEELGWRGTLQPLMEKVISKKIKSKTLRFVVTVIAIGLIWAIWHLPLWFVTGCMQQSINYGLFIIECIVLSFILGVVYQKTHSVLYCMIIHGLANVIFGLFIVGVNYLLVIGFILMVALSIVLSAFPRATNAQKAK